MGFLMILTITLFIIISVFLILLILIQKGRGGGLASAFGGAGGNTAFGSKTGDVLTWATSIVFGIFLILGVALNLMAKSQIGDSGAVNPQAPVSSQVPEGAGDPGVRDDAQPERAPDGPTGLAAPAPSTQPQ